MKTKTEWTCVDVSTNPCVLPRKYEVTAKTGGEYVRAIIIGDDPRLFDHVISAMLHAVERVETNEQRT